MTPRLFARRTRMEDAQDIFTTYAADPEVTRYLTWSAHPTVNSIEEYLKIVIGEWDSGAGFRYELCLLDSDTPIGSIRLRLEKTSILFGYVLARPFWGRGLMAEALAFAVDWTLAQPEMFRAYAFCDVDNVASVRVMEKAGMTREGVLRRWHVCPNIGPEPRDCVICAKVR